MRLVEKPWGYEQIWAETDRYAGKFLFIRSGERLSRQYHEVKDETICVLDGILTVEIGTEPINAIALGRGEHYHVQPGTVHRFCADMGDVRLVEVSTAELNDVIRLEDKYDRPATASASQSR